MSTSAPLIAIVSGGQVFPAGLDRMVCLLQKWIVVTLEKFRPFYAFDARTQELV